MDFHEKLARLLAEKNQTRFAADADVGRTALNKYVNGKAEPPAKSALKIARQLRVTLDWLVDPTQPWEAKDHIPTPEPDLSSVTLSEVKDSMARRLVEDRRAVLYEADQLAKIDWMPVAQRCYRALNTGQKPTRQDVALCRRAVKFEFDCEDLASFFYYSDEVRAYDPDAPAMDDEASRDYGGPEAEQRLGAFKLVPSFAAVLPVTFYMRRPDLEDITATLEHLEQFDRQVPEEFWAETTEGYDPETDTYRLPDASPLRPAAKRKPGPKHKRKPGWAGEEAG